MLDPSGAHFKHYDASQLLELDVLGRAVWSVPTTSDFSLSSRLNDDDDRDLLFDDDGVPFVSKMCHQTVLFGLHLSVDCHVPLN